MASVLVISGFVKAVDPEGMGYKLEGYLDYLGIPLGGTDTFTLMGVVGLATIEFVLGIYLLLGIRRRLAATATLVLMTVMTAISVFIYWIRPVEDCGCFGAAWTLGPGETLVKNIILLAMAIVLVRKSRFMLRLITERNQWITVVWSWMYIILLGLYSQQYLPPVDFTAFKTGVNLRQAWNSPTAETPPALIGFDLSTPEGNSLTEEILADTGATFLLILSDIDRADDGCNDRINDICDLCQDKGGRFYAVAAHNTTEQQRSQWTDRSGAAYPYLLTDGDQIKNMVRSNPGLMLINNGIIIDKWSNNNLPSSRMDGIRMEGIETESLHVTLARLVLWFILPLLLVITADRLWIGSKYYRHYRIMKRLLSHDSVEDAKSKPQADNMPNTESK